MQHQKWTRNLMKHCWKMFTQSHTSNKYWSFPGSCFNENTSQNIFSSMLRCLLFCYCMAILKYSLHYWFKFIHIPRAKVHLIDEIQIKTNYLHWSVHINIEYSVLFAVQTEICAIRVIILRTENDWNMYYLEGFTFGTEGYEFIQLIIWGVECGM